MPAQKTIVGTLGKTPLQVVVVVGSSPVLPGRATSKSTDGENLKELEPEAALAPRQGRTMIDRAIRHEIRVPLRYRRAGEEDWSPGESVNMSESGILFSSDRLLEIDSRVEITFQTIGPLLLDRSTRQALVVRRTLNNWPETRLLFGAKFCP